MRIRLTPTVMGKAAVITAGLLVLALFLQWIGLPVSWPEPPHTLYSELGHLVG